MDRLRVAMSRARKPSGTALSIAARELDEFMDAPMNFDGDGSAEEGGAWRDYAHRRGLQNWLATDEGDAPAETARLQLMSKMLTYPLTLSSCLQSHCKGASKARELRIAVIGARAEATLPSKFWKEASVFLPAASNVHLYFVGPHVPEEAQAYSSSFCNIDGDRVKYHFHFENALYHDSSAQERISEANACGSSDVHASAIAFNSGLSHERVRMSWLPTIEALTCAGIPAIFTCFNVEDYRLDATYVASNLGWTTDWFFSSKKSANSIRRSSSSSKDVDPSRLSRAITAASGCNAFRSLWLQHYATERARGSGADEEIVGCNEAYIVTEA